MSFKPNEIKDILDEEFSSFHSLDVLGILSAPQQKVLELHNLYYELLKNVFVKIPDTLDELAGLPFLDLNADCRDQFPYGLGAHRLFTLINVHLRGCEDTYLCTMDDLIKPKKTRTLDLIGSLLNQCLFDKNLRRIADEEAALEKELDQDKRELLAELQLLEAESDKIDQADNTALQAIAVTNKEFTVIYSKMQTFADYEYPEIEAGMKELVQQGQALEEELATLDHQQTELMAEIESLKMQVLDNPEQFAEDMRELEVDIGELKLSLQDLAEKQAARAHKRETYTNVSLVLKQLKEEVEKVLQIESRDTEMFNKAKTVQKEFNELRVQYEDKKSELKMEADKTEVNERQTVIFRNKMERIDLQKKGEVDELSLEEVTLAKEMESQSEAHNRWQKLLKERGTLERGNEQMEGLLGEAQAEYLAQAEELYKQADLTLIRLDKEYHQLEHDLSTESQLSHTKGGEVLDVVERKLLAAMQGFKQRDMDVAEVERFGDFLTAFRTIHTELYTESRWVPEQVEPLITKLLELTDNRAECQQLSQQIQLIKEQWNTPYVPLLVANVEPPLDKISPDGSQPEQLELRRVIDHRLEELASAVTENVTAANGMDRELQLLTLRSGLAKLYRDHTVCLLPKIAGDLKVIIDAEVRRDNESLQTAIHLLKENKEEKAKREAERLAELARVAEEERIAEEKRIAGEARISALAEEERLAEVARLAEEARLVEEEKFREIARLEEAERLAEEKRLAEAARVKEEEEMRANEELERQAKEELERQTKEDEDNKENTAKEAERTSNEAKTPEEVMDVTEVFGTSKKMRRSTGDELRKAAETKRDEVRSEEGALKARAEETMEFTEVFGTSKKLRRSNEIVRLEPKPKIMDPQTETKQAAPKPDTARSVTPLFKKSFLKPIPAPSNIPTKKEMFQVKTPQAKPRRLTTFARNTPGSDWETGTPLTPKQRSILSHYQSDSPAPTRRRSSVLSVGSDRRRSFINDTHVKFAAESSSDDEISFKTPAKAVATPVRLTPFGTLPRRRSTLGITPSKDRLSLMPQQIDYSEVDISPTLSPGAGKRVRTATTPEQTPVKLGNPTCETQHPAKKYLFSEQGEAAEQAESMDYECTTDADITEVVYGDKMASCQPRPIQPVQVDASPIKPVSPLELTPMTRLAEALSASPVVLTSLPCHMANLTGLSRVGTPSGASTFISRTPRARQSSGPRLVGMSDSICTPVQSLDQQRLARLLRQERTPLEEGEVQSPGVNSKTFVKEVHNLTFTADASLEEGELRSFMETPAPVTEVRHGVASETPRTLNMSLEEGEIRSFIQPPRPGLKSASTSMNNTRDIALTLEEGELVPTPAKKTGTKSTSMLVRENASFVDRRGVRHSQSKLSMASLQSTDSPASPTPASPSTARPDSLASPTPASPTPASTDSPASPAPARPTPARPDSPASPARATLAVNRSAVLDRTEYTECVRLIEPEKTRRVLDRNSITLFEIQPETAPDCNTETAPDCNETAPHYTEAAPDCNDSIPATETVSNHAIEAVDSPDTLLLDPSFTDEPNMDVSETVVVYGDKMASARPRTVQPVQVEALITSADSVQPTVEEVKDVEGVQEDIHDDAGDGYVEDEELLMPEKVITIVKAPKTKTPVMERVPLKMDKYSSDQTADLTFSDNDDLEEPEWLYTFKPDPVRKSSVQIYNKGITDQGTIVMLSEMPLIVDSVKRNPAYHG